MNKQKLKLTAFMLAAVIFSGCSQSGSSAEIGSASAEPESVSIFAMDTYMTITVYDGDKSSALSAAQQKIQELEKLLSVTDEDSEVYRINHNGGEAVEVSAETAELIDFALDMNEQTGGALDITLYPVLCEWGFTTGEYKVPSEETISELLKKTGSDKVKLEGRTVTVSEGTSIDLGSVGKGETGDRICDILRQNGVTSALLDLGGNIQLLGSKPDGSDWKIGLKSPFDTSDNIAKLELSDCCVITSGGYERYFTDDDGNIYWHILDPKTGFPAKSGMISATVIGKSGRLCDALSTSLFVMGEEKAKELWESRDDFEFVLITDDDRLIMTEGLEGRLTLYEGYSDMKTETVRKG